MAYGVTLTVPTVTGSHGNFAAVIVCNGTRNDLPPAAFDGPNAFANGGDDFVTYVDSSKTQRLACEIVRFVTGPTPDIEVHVSVLTYETNSTIYCEKDTAQVTQPAPSSTYGSEAVWSDYQVVMHLNDLTDSTGNTTPTQANATSGATGQLGDGYSFNGSSSRIDAVFPEVPFADAFEFMLQSWGQHGTTVANSECLVSIADSSLPDKQYRLTEGAGGFIFSVFDGTSSGPLVSGIPSGNVFYSAVSNSQTSRTIYRDDGSVSGTDTTSVNVWDIDRLTIGTTADSTPFGYWGGMADEVRLRFSVPTDQVNWIAAEYANQSATTAFYTNDGWTDTGGTPTDALLADDLESSSELSTPSIGQVHALTADDLQSTSELSTPALGQIHNLTADDLESASELSRPTISVGGTDALLADDLESVSTLTRPALGQIHALIADDLESVIELSSPAIGQIHILLADDLESVSELSSPGLNRAYTRAPAIRTLILSAESRILSPSAETRTETIAAESRTLTI